MIFFIFWQDFSQIKKSNRNNFKSINVASLKKHVVRVFFFLITYEKQLYYYMHHVK